MKALQSFFLALTNPHESVKQSDERNIARLFAAISLFIAISIIPVNLPFYFSDIVGTGNLRTFEFLFRSIIPEQILITLGYFLARSKYYRFSGILMNVSILLLVSLVVTYDYGNPYMYLLLQWFLIAINFGVLSLTFRWQVVQYIGIIALTLLLPFFFPWIDLDRVINDVLLILIVIGGTIILIGKFVSHQESTRLKTIVHLHNQYTLKEREIEEAKDSFFSVVSHELRTPITKIRWGMDAFKDKLPASEYENVSIIDESIDRINEVLKTMFVYSRVASGTVKAEPESFALSSVLQELKQKYEPEAEKKGLQFFVADTSVPFFASKEYLTYILDQYLDNAFTFTQSGSVSVLVEGNTVSVADTGPGIPKSDQSKIFGSYYQKGGALGRDQAKGGLGLSLSLVKLLANKSNMQVGFESTEGKGSTFFVSVGEKV